MPLPALLLLLVVVRAAAWPAVVQLLPAHGAVHAPAAERLLLPRWVLLRAVMASLLTLLLVAAAEAALSELMPLTECALGARSQLATALAELAQAGKFAQAVVAAWLLAALALVQPWMTVPALSATKALSPGLAAAAWALKPDVAVRNAVTAAFVLAARRAAVATPALTALLQAPAETL